MNDLTADDFEVLEDGKPQKVTSFSLVNIPIERAERPLFAAQPIEADVQTNDHIEGRIYLIVLDDLHTDFTRTPRVKAAMRRFFERSFGINDLAAIVFTGRSNGSQDFTNNPRLLMAAVDKFVGRKLRSATIEKLEGVRVNPETGGLQVGDDNQMMERSFNARNAMGTMRKLAEFMANVRGRRKAMLLVGEGVDYDIHEAVGLAGSTASAVLLDTHDAIASATRGNVSIYAIDPRGLTTGSEDLITQSSTFPEQGAGLQSLQNELRLSQDSLRVLAANTGGFAAVNRNDFNTAFDRIVQENSQYYLLGYYSNNNRRDGRYRKIQIRVKRPGLRVARARNGYYEPRGRRPADPAPGTLNPALTAAHRQPAAGVRHAGEGLCRRFQGRGAQRGRGRGARARRVEAGFRPGQRHVQRVPRVRQRRHQFDRQGVPRRAAHGEPDVEARHLRARQGTRLPPGDADEPAAGALSAAPGGRQQDRQVGQRAVRPRDPGLLQGRRSR